MLAFCVVCYVSLATHLCLHTSLPPLFLPYSPPITLPRLLSAYGMYFLYLFQCIVVYCVFVCLCWTKTFVLRPNLFCYGAINRYLQKSGRSKRKRVSKTSMIFYFSISIDNYLVAHTHVWYALCIFITYICKDFVTRFYISAKFGHHFFVRFVFFVVDIFQEQRFFA